MAFALTESVISSAQESSRVSTDDWAVGQCVYESVWRLSSSESRRHTSAESHNMTYRKVVDGLAARRRNTSNSTGIITPEIYNPSFAIPVINTCLDKQKNGGHHSTKNTTNILLASSMTMTTNLSTPSILFQE